ncbi:MAG: hypothetical protein M3301_08020, partial [Chloroflexota bacterium]|nr:hypothetical protein [Chloroflexota bacterium]
GGSSGFGAGATNTSVAADTSGSPAITFNYRPGGPGGAGGAGGPPGGAGSATRATISSLSATNSIFTVAGSSTPLTGRTAARRHKAGTVFSFRLDQDAAVEIAFTTRKRGRRVGRRCKPPSRRLRHRKRCTRTVTAGKLSRSGHAGLNKVAFSGRIGRRALRPGRYRAVFRAIRAAGTSAPRSLGFRIVRR